MLCHNSSTINCGTQVFFPFFFSFKFFKFLVCVTAYDACLSSTFGIITDDSCLPFNVCIFGANELLGLEFGQADANSTQKVFPILNSKLQY